MIQDKNIKNKEVKEKNNVKHLFVYGKLMQGEGLHYLLIKKGFKFISKATLKNYDLYKYSETPFIIPSSSGNSEVFGEVYEILNPICLKYIDDIEASYNRIISEVNCSNRKIMAFIYSYKYSNLIKENKLNYLNIKSGNWKIQNKTKEELEEEVKLLIQENKLLNKKIKYTKNCLFNFRQKCYSEMITDDSYLVLPNDTFNTLFENLVNKFRKNKI